MARRTKTGSSRRKGDEYQDLTALQLVLESYIDGEDFQVFVEYEEAGSLDDVVVVLPDCVHAYQVKHAVSNNAVYNSDNLTDPASVVFMEKFAKSWEKLNADYPGQQLTGHLRSNRALDAQLAAVVDVNGFFDEKFRENRYRKEKRKLRTAIFGAAGLPEQEFQQFLYAFHFDLKQRPWLELETYIQAVLLDHKLGISDRRIFADLKRLIEKHAIETASPITSDIIDSFFRETQTRYLLPQSFTVDRDRFVRPPTLKEQLDDQLSRPDGGYVVVTGPPGSGKSTALTEYCNELAEKAPDRFIVVRYYCFVRVNDNYQKLRLEAKSLRVNLLTELQRRFPRVLDSRRFDFSEDQFYEAFEKISKHCADSGIKLIVLLDGLDHVERDDEIRTSVIAALPAEVPEKIFFLIGTQELNRWKPLALKKGREERHIEMPLFSWDETRTYVVDRCGIAIDDETVYRVFEKSAGLPLYLRYLAERLSQSNDLAEAINSVPAAVDGDIRTYYETLWAGFELDGRCNARYLSSVLASLRFSIHEDELRKFQVGITNAPRFEEAYSRVRHLLRRDKGLISIFHNSFRVFVLDHTNPTTRKEIATGIISRLKLEELQSPRWFKHAFRFALEAEEFDYVLKVVNREFVDAALMRFRSAEEIADGIDCAIDAAGATENLVELARLGSLKFRTHERLEYTFPWSVLTDILLYQGRVDQVVDSIYSEESNRIVAGDGHSLGIMLRLAELRMSDLGGKLFAAFLKDFHGTKNLDKEGIVILARCAGVFKTRPISLVRWLSGITLKRDILEPEDLSVQYAPHLAAYLDGLVRSGREKIWRRLKRLESPFSNQLMRQLIIRAVAKWSPREQLRSELEEYVGAYPEDTNIELAFYAAQSGFSRKCVSHLAGQFHLPPEAASRGALRTDLQNHLLRFAYWAVVLGYENNAAVINQLRARFATPEAVWASTLLHLLKVGEVVGSHSADREIDWFGCASMAIDALEAACDVPGERTPEALDASRSILDKSLRWLSETITERCPDRTGEWAGLLGGLRNSFIWRTHYGIGELRTDYSFEFPIWEKQLELPRMKGRLRSVLVECAESYTEARSLKGGLRGDHFLTLASLAAKHGFNSDASQWFEYGVRASLAYGYNKDITLEKLTDVLDLLGKHRPERVLQSAAAILEMIKLVPYATDERSTKHFAQYLFPTIMTHSRAAALEVLSTYYRAFARWQADESVSKYIVARKDGDPEFLWALCALLDPNDSFEPRQHIAALGSSTSRSASADQWTSRLSNYTRIMINPRHWPEDLWERAIKCHDRPIRQQRYQSSTPADKKDHTYLFEGIQITEEDAMKRCQSSFEEMVETLDKLKAGNDYIPDYKLIAVLPDHIGKAGNSEQLGQISEFIERVAVFDKEAFWKRIAHRYLDLGDIPNGLKCLERTVHETPLSDAFNMLAEYDRGRAAAFLVSDLAERLHGPAYHGLNAPNVVANACDVLGDHDAIERVFDDFLLHCQELFSQLPPEHSFDTLHDWDNDDCDEGTQILHLLIDRLATREAESGDRLVCAISQLAESRSDKVLPVLVDRLNSAEGLQLWRLLQVFERLSRTSQQLVRQHSHVLTPLLRRGNVLLTLIASRMIQSARSGEDPMPDEVNRELEKVARRYSPVISYRGFRILQNLPSEDFIELTKEGTLVSFQRQLKGACQILDLDTEAVTAHLERRLLETGTTLDEERATIKSMRHAFSHAQGWPIIWYISDFHVRVCDLLYETIDEVLLKQAYQPWHLEAVWRIIQPCDPDFSFSELAAMPADLAPLLVTQKDDWIGPGNEETALIIEETLGDEWITAFEFRQLAQDNPYHREFVSQTHVRSALVVPERTGEARSFDPDLWEEKVGTHHPAENLTWQQFCEALIEGHPLELSGNEDCIPFASFNRKHSCFLGFDTIAALSSKIIRDHGLMFDGFSLLDGNECVARFEAWQEGYSDEDYCDAPLAFGVRLRVRAEFIRTVCRKTGRAFAIRTRENRVVPQDYSPEPSETCSRISIRVWPADIEVFRSKK